MKRLEFYADSMYRSIVAGMKIDEAAQANMDAYYDTMMAPIAAQQAELAIQIEREGIDEQKAQNQFNNVLSIIGLGLGAITGIGGLL